MRHLRETNLLRETPAEARGYLDFSEVTELGQTQPGGGVTGGLFLGVTAAVAIRYAMTAKDPAWMTGAAWLVGILAGFTGLQVIGKTLGSPKA